MITEMLLPSTDDKVSLTHVVQNKLSQIINLRVQHGESPLPEEIEKKVIRIREMYRRYMCRNFFHTNTEMMLEQEVAQWCVREFHKINGSEIPDHAKGIVS